MNQEPQNQGAERQAQNQRPAGAEPVNGAPRRPANASVHPVKQRREQKNRKKLRILQLIMAAVVVMILIVGILLLTLPMFRVKTIKVEGNSFYTAEQIRAASGIEIGDEIWSVIAKHNSREIDNGMYKVCPYLESIRISCGISTVTITVTEAQNVMYAEGTEGWYAFDTDLLVWEKNAEESAFSPFLRVKLPPAASVQVGQTIQFANPNISYGYIGELIEGLQSAEVLEHVTYIDFSDKFSVSCVIEDTVRMELGDTEALARKLDCFYGILKEKNSADCAVIDVTDPTKATYRKIDQTELYQ